MRQFYLYLIKLKEYRLLDLAAFASLLFFNLFLIITVWSAIYGQFDIRKYATTSASSTVGGPRGTSGDLWADIVLGKDNFGEGVPGEVVPYKTFNPGGTLMDRSVKPNRLYLYDGTNSRILGYKSLGVCVNNTSIPCTADSDCTSGTCNIQVGGPNGKMPDIVIGQPDFYHSACNGDSNFQNYPLRAPASSTSLCSVPESQISTSEGGSFASMAVDPAGNFYVADFDNNRVLKYNRPFTTDRVANQVWGQADFTGNSCNRGRGVGSPDNQSFCFRSPFNEGFGAGVDIDKAGNLWVTDNVNQRVLRFIKDPTTGVIRSTANLVLGQPNFTSSAGGSGLNQMHAPVALRISASGSVYVADSWNNRILVFNPPFTSGMKASRTFGSNFNYPTGIEFDPKGEGIWVSDTLNQQLVLFDLSGQVKKVLFKDIYHPDGRCGSSTADYNSGCINPQKDPVSGQTTCWANLCDVSGSVGIDNDGNVFPGSRVGFAQDVMRFKAPIPTPVAGKVYSSDHRFYYPPTGSNLIYGNKGFDSPRGIAVSSSQVIISDSHRIMYWNTPNGLSNLSNGKAADGVAALPNFNSPYDSDFGRIALQGDQYLWVAKGYWPSIDVYTLPLTFGQKASKTFITLGQSLPILGGGQLTFDNDVGGNAFADVDVTSDGKYLWVTQPNRNRVFRVRDPLTNPVVDIVLGQKTLAGTQCNQGDPNYNPPVIGRTGVPLNYLCNPGSARLDRFGNLFVSDHALEVSGNGRLLMFAKSTLADNPSTIIFAPLAAKVFDNQLTWEPAFNSANQMVVGYNGYSGARFPGVYNNPLSSATAPSTYIKDYWSMPYAATFDSQNNLYIADLNRGRVLIYKNPLNAPVSTLPVSTPTISPTPMLTPGGQTPTPNQAITPTVALFPTPTPVSLTSTPAPTGADTTPPKVYINYPQNGALVKGGSVVTITATATDNVGVGKVKFFVNGVLICTDTTYPYSCAWNVPLVGSVSKVFTIMAQAFDLSLNQASTQISVTVQ